MSTVQRHDNKGSHLHKWCHWSKGARLRSEQVPSLSIGNQHREVVDHVWQADNRTLGNSFCCMDSTFIRHEPNYWCRLSVQHFAKQGKKGVETARSYAFQCCTPCHIPMCVLLMDGTAFDFPSHGGMGHKFSSVPKQVFFSNISRNRKTVLTGLLIFYTL